MKNGQNPLPNSPIKQLYGSVDHATANLVSGQIQGQSNNSEVFSPQYPNRKARSINQRIKNPKIYQSAVEMMQNNHNFGGGSM